MLHDSRLTNGAMLHQTLILLTLAILSRHLAALQVAGNLQQAQQLNSSQQQQLPSLSERANGGNGRYLTTSGSAPSAAVQPAPSQNGPNQDSNNRAYLSHQQQQVSGSSAAQQQQQVTTSPSVLADTSGPKFNSAQGQPLANVPVMSTTYTFNPLLGQFLPSDLSAGSIPFSAYQQQQQQPPPQQFSPAFQQPYRFGPPSPQQLPANQFVYAGPYGMPGLPQRASNQQLNQFFRRGGYTPGLSQRPVSSFFGQPTAIIDDESPYFQSLQQQQQQQQPGLITSINGFGLDSASYGSAQPSNSYLPINANQLNHHQLQQQQQQQYQAQQQELQQQFSQQQGQSYGEPGSALTSSSSLSSILLPSPSTSFSAAFSGPPPVSSSLGSDYKSAEQCVAADNRHGTCYQASECIKRGGTPMGKCSPSSSEFSGSSYVCCLFDVTCGQFAAERFVYFRNPNYPNTYDQSRMCRAKIGKLDKGVCQYRLDLLRFDVAKPTNGNCSNDMFVVSGQNENYVIPKICGLNDGQHYHVGVDESGVITLHMMMMGFYRRSFEIMITQIPCRSDYAAPAHCLQYYMGTHGTIKSFNYEDQQQQQQYADPLQGSPSDLSFGASSSMAAPYGLQFNGQLQQRQLLNSRYSTLYKQGGYANLAGSNTGDQFGGYPNDLDYTMCIRKESGFCSITYQLSRDEQGVQPFAVGYQAYGLNNTDTSLNPASNGWNAGVSTECRDDYLLIGGVRLCSGNQQAVNYGGASASNPASPYDIGAASIQFAHNGTILSSAGIGGRQSSLSIDQQYQAQQLQNQHQFLLQQLAKIQQQQQQQATAGNVSYFNNGNNVNNPTSSLTQQTAAINNLDQQQAAILQQVMLVQQQLASLLSSSASVNSFIASQQGNKYQNDSPPTDYPAAIITDNTPGPFILRFKSNMARNARGFQIDFRQNPCK